MFEPGTIVTWESQAGGSTKRKTGKILAFVPKNEDGFKNIPLFGDGDYCAKLPFSRIKGQKHSQIDRYLVEVPHGGKSKLCDYYLPYANKVEAI